MAQLLGTPSWLAVDVFSAGSDSSDPIGTIAADRIVSFGTRHGRESVNESAGPGDVTMTLKGGWTFTSAADGVTPLPLTVGLVIRVYITGDGLAPWPADTYPNRTDLQVRFVGAVTDLGDVDLFPGDPDTVVVPLTGTTGRARFGNKAYSQDFGSNMPSWLAYETDEMTIDRALEALWAMDPSPFVQVPVFVESSTESFPNSALFIESYDYFDGKTLNDVISVYEAATGGTFIERRKGSMKWMLPAERRNVPPPLILDPSWILAPLRVRQGIGDIVNFQRVSMYAGGTAGAAVEVEDEQSQLDYGFLPGDTIDTLLNILSVDLSDRAVRQGTELAGGIVGRFAKPTWTTPAITIDVTALMIQGLWDAAYGVLALDVAHLVQLDALPRRFPGAPGLYWVEQLADDVTAGRWRVTLSLVPYSVLTPGTRWQDLPAAGLTWNDVPADLTWNESVSYDPAPYPVGAYRSEPSDLRYRDSTATWATI